MKDTNDIVDKNQLGAGQVERYVPWVQINERKYRRTMTPRHYLLYLMVTAMPPRRAHIFKTLRVFYRKPRDDKGLNYILLQKKNNKMKTIVLNDWKNFDTQGVWTGHIPEIINRFVYKNLKGDLGNGELLFSDSNLPEVLKNIVGANGITDDILRRSYVTEWFASNPNASLERIKIEAKKLGHSYQQMLKYRVVD